MTVSVFDLFSIGIGPSSSHTVGPMRAARRFALALEADGVLEQVRGLRCELFGSLGATGHGHGSPMAVLLGLEGAEPETVEVGTTGERVEKIRQSGTVWLLGRTPVPFRVDEDLVMHRRRTLPFHPNGLLFVALGVDGQVLRESTYYSVGGGFVVAHAEDGRARVVPEQVDVPYPFRTADELLARCHETGWPVSQVMLANEQVRRTPEQVRSGLLHIWAVMQECVHRGCQAEGVMPGGLRVRRRAAELARSLRAEGDRDDPLRVLDWVNLFALAVNEENASGGRVVTAPTNGAAGIIPAVLHYYVRFVPEADEDGVVRFLLTAGAIGSIYKETASISGAEVGCQGEVGSACSMAAGALTEVLGGTPQQVENAAEIAMEHNLGLTCDPVGGLVQIPCIERNAMASVKAINAARMALRGDGQHVVSLDKVIKTMRETGADMKVKYKETSRGGLAVNVIEC
ncbi:MAG: L-serine ammonia-lyase [Actinomycetes bacterium]